MSSFLVQWNPAKCLGPYREFANGHCAAWRFAAHKASKIGDEVFMRRSGSERLGIVVQGRITGFTEPMQTRWGSRVSPMVQFVVDKIADEDGDPLASDDDLFAIDDSQQWRSQSSGISINPDAAARLRDHISLSPNERAYRIFGAFLEMPPTETEKRLIHVLLDNPGFSSAQLSFRMGWKGKSAWHMHFGIMCKKREHLLWPAPDGFSFGKWYGAILVKWAGKASDGGTGFRLRPAAMRAFDPLGLHNS